MRSPTQEEGVTSATAAPQLDRRTLLKGAAAAGVAQFAAPFVVIARAADEIRLGAQRSAYRHLCRARQERADRLRIGDRADQHQRGILGRKAELLVEDSTSGDTGTAVQKARKLIERDKVDFLLGNVNSAMAIALGQVSNELKTLHIVTGGHNDSVTGADCHWNVFRVCNTTRMETNSVAKSLFNKYGKRVFRDTRLRLRPYTAARL
jgi:branched-chain amino acid transport system substrate-binding protein